MAATNTAAEEAACLRRVVAAMRREALRLLTDVPSSKIGVALAAYANDLDAKADSLSTAPEGDN